MTASAVTAWERVKLGDIGESLIGLTFDPSAVKRPGTLVLRASNIQDGQLTFDDSVFVDCPIPKRIRVRDQDILICVRNGSRRLIGKSVMLDDRVVGETFGAFMAVFRSPANPYLRYYFQSDDFKRQIDEHLGATINQITNGSMRSFRVSLPDQPERDEIVARLNDADRLIELLEKLSLKKRAIKQAMMQQLLTGAVRLPGFADAWRPLAFGDLAAPASDRVDPRTMPPTSVVVELEHIESATGRLITVRSAADVVSLKTRFLPGDVLFGKLRAYLRKFWLADEPGLCTTEIWAFRAKPNVAARYVRYLVETERFIDAASGAYGTHMPRSDWGTVRRLIFDVPALPEQEAIGAVLSEVDDELDALRRRLMKARAIKAGMMQELLTGRTRLPIMEPAV